MSVHVCVDLRLTLDNFLYHSLSCILRLGLLLSRLPGLTTSLPRGLLSASCMLGLQWAARFSWISCSGALSPSPHAFKTSALPDKLSPEPILEPSSKTSHTMFEFLFEQRIELKNFSMTTLYFISKLYLLILVENLNLCTPLVRT